MNFKNASDQKGKQSGNDCDEKTSPILYLLMQSETSSADCAVTSRKNMTKKSLIFSKRSSDVRKNCVCEVESLSATKKPPTK